MQLLFPLTAYVILASASHHPDVTSDLGEVELQQKDATYDYSLKRENVKITPDSLNLRISLVEGGESAPPPDVYIGEKDLAIHQKADEAYFLGMRESYVVLY